jgi:hypothetical protein
MGPQDPRGLEPNRLRRRAYPSAQVAGRQSLLEETLPMRNEGPAALPLSLTGACALPSSLGRLGHRQRRREPTGPGCSGPSHFLNRSLAGS